MVVRKSTQLLINNDVKSLSVQLIDRPDWLGRSATVVVCRLEALSLCRSEAAQAERFINDGSGNGFGSRPVGIYKAALGFS
jgi:hypothetical protein